MKKTGADLAIFALEQIGVKYTYGIPGTHTTELYDKLNSSEKITPILVTHESGASFMGDATSRTSNAIGTLVIVPAAGLTHAMSGIAEAFLDGIPLLIISGGIRKDLNQAYQLHGIDQLELAKPVTKAQFLIKKQADIIPTIYKAYDIAISGEPGPVFIDIPVDIQMYTGEVNELPTYKPSFSKPVIDKAKIVKAADMLTKAEHPMIYLGWGAVDGFEYSVKLAELLAAPVATSLQGKSSFPNSHPLFTSASLGKGAKPSGQWALGKQDVMLAVGARFGEVATASYSLEPPKNLIHVDINPNVFDKNFKTTLAIEADGADFLKALYEELVKRNFKSKLNWQEIGTEISKKNEDYFNEWTKGKKSNIVQPGYFFKALQNRADKNALMVTDDGQHTFLSAELFNVNQPRHFISPTDFNCMGYCVPAAIAAKLNNPDKQVISIVGDGAVLMTGLELITSSTYNVPVFLFIFNDGELGQIAQFQQVPLNRKTCTVLGNVNYEGLGIIAGIKFIEISNDNELDSKLDEAFRLNKEGKSIVINVKIDYSQRTMLTKGALTVNLKRMPFSQKLRFIGRAIKRHIVG
jgi:acetolactate synthase-1/2/3 large subunit